MNIVETRSKMGRVPLVECLGELPDDFMELCRIFVGCLIMQPKIPIPQIETFAKDGGLCAAVLSFVLSNIL